MYVANPKKTKYQVPQVSSPKHNGLNIKIITE